jgi:methyl-CpG-binding domain protein 4
MITPLRDDLMVQQQIDGAWQHFVGVIMLNQTGRKPVKTVLPAFLAQWSTPDEFLNSLKEEVIDVVRPLGMSTVRENRIRRMSMDFLNWDHNDATKLYGIGKYGSDSYEIFFKQNYSVEPTDKELKRYLKEEIYEENQMDESMV